MDPVALVVSLGQDCPKTLTSADAGRLCLIAGCASASTTPDHDDALPAEQALQALEAQAATRAAECVVAKPGGSDEAGVPRRPHLLAYWPIRWGHILKVRDPIWGGPWGVQFGENPTMTIIFRPSCRGHGKQSEF